MHVMFVETDGIAEEGVECQTQTGRSFDVFFMSDSINNIRYFWCMIPTDKRTVTFLLSNKFGTQIM